MKQTNRKKRLAIGADDGDTEIVDFDNTVDCDFYVSDDVDDGDGEIFMADCDFVVDFSVSDNDVDVDAVIVGDTVKTCL